MKRRLTLLGAVALAALTATLALPAPAGASTCASLQTDANTATDGQVVTAPPGACNVNLTITNTHAFVLQGAPAGSTLEPLTATTPIISANADVRFTIAGITFTGMNGASAVSVDGGPAGAGITVDHDTFTANNAGSGSGAAIDLSTGATASTPPTVIQNSVFNGNVARSDGAVFIGGKPAVLIAHNAFTANHATSFDGGAVGISNGFGSGSNPITLAGNAFGGGNASDGNTSVGPGGAVSIGASHAQPVTITSNTFADNQIAGAGTATSNRLGGGLVVTLHADDTGYNVNQSDNRFIDNVISETAAPAHPGLAAGGAGEWAEGVTVHSTRDLFKGNQITVADGAPPEGAGLGVLGFPGGGGQPAQPGKFVGDDDLFEENTAPVGGWGGAVYVGGPEYIVCTTDCPGSSLTLRDSTVIRNTVAPGAGSNGGGLWGSGNDSLVVDNSIIFGNDAGAGKPDIFGFHSPTLSFSDICARPAGSTGRGDICADPRLGPDASETPSSPTVDAGSNALVPGGLTSDFAGHARIAAGHVPCPAGSAARVDMGAFEAQTATPQICLIVRRVHAHASKLTLTVRCKGPSGGRCRSVASLFTKGHRTPVGRKRFSVRSGHRLKLTIRLNGHGRSLLRRSHRLHVRLVVTLEAAAGQQVVARRRVVLQRGR